MIKMLLTFVVLFTIFYFGIGAINKLTKQEKWDFAKTFSYSIALSLAVIVCMVSMVFLF